eukprot:5672511-Pyramimonas_sp.AAC.1
MDVVMTPGSTNSRRQHRFADPSPHPHPHPSRENSSAIIRHKLVALRADFLDPRRTPPGGAPGAAPGALRAPGRGVQRRSKKT